MISSRSKAFQIARSRPVVTTAIKLALIVGTVLALINHGPSMMRFSLSIENILQILVTYLVPYSVSTYSAVAAVLNQEARDGE